MLKMNHIGIVVESIDNYLKYSQYSSILSRIFDPIQLSEICLIETNESEPNIELIVPKNKDSSTYNFLLSRGGGLHHICYEVDEIIEAEKFMRDNNIKKIFGPVKAVVFDYKEVVFGYTKNKEIIEFLVR